MMTKEISDMSKDDIFNTELIGGGLPDLETEIKKLQSGQTGFQAGNTDFVEQDELEEEE